MNVWLDDIRPAPKGWVWAKSADEMINLIEGCRFGFSTIDEASFDHDLGEDVPTGYDVLKLIEKAAAQGVWAFVPKKMHVHSANPVGRKNMQAAIDSIERMRNVTG